MATKKVIEKKTGTPLHQTAKPTKGLVSASKKPAAATTDTKGTAAPKARTLTATPNAIPKGTLLLQKKAPAKMKKC